MMWMRSKLFVPAIRPELFEKALRSEADAVCFDLEDAVSPERKQEARGCLAAFLVQHGNASPLLLARVNPVDSADFQADLEACVVKPLYAIALPKVSSSEEIAAAERLLAELEGARELRRPIGILPTIETARGLRFASEIALSSRRVIGLQIGFADLFEPLGIPTDNQAARNQVRLMVRLAAAEADLDCYDSAFVSFKDAAGFERHLQAAIASGFAGTSCIHPSQIAAANRAFTPSDDAVRYAESVLRAARTAAANGDAVTTVDGEMVDRPFILRAQRLLARVQRGNCPMRLSKFSFSLILIAGVWNGHAYGGTLQAHPLNHNGYQRPYLVYRPDGVGPHAAMVCVLGGTGSTAESTARDLGWTEEADREHFVVVFPEPLTREPLQPFVKYTNTTFWEMQGSRTHVIPPGARPIDDDGYLMAVLDDALRAASIDRRRVYFTGFSSGSGMAQLLASRHPRAITTIAAVATPLMEPPRSLGRPMPLLYIHGDDDEQFSGFEVNSPDFATTPHGNWVTWGYLDGCHIQRAKKTDWGVQLTWGDCKAGTPVIAMFVKGLGHEYLANAESPWNQKMRHDDPLIFPKITWLFFSALSK